MHKLQRPIDSLQPRMRKIVNMGTMRIVSNWVVSCDMTGISETMENLIKNKVSLYTAAACRNFVVFSCECYINFYQGTTKESSL